MVAVVEYSDDAIIDRTPGCAAQGGTGRRPHARQEAEPLSA